MAEPITIRILGPGDAAVLDRVAEGVFDGPVRPDQAAFFLGSSAHVIAVALVGDLVIGMATGVLYLHPDKLPQLWISEVGTGDDWRRRGAARGTVQALLDLAQARGWQTPFLLTEAENTPARALYRAMGGAEEAGKVLYTFLADPTKD